MILNRPINCAACGNDAEPHRMRSGELSDKCKPCHKKAYRAEWGRNNRARVTAATLRWKQRYPERVRNAHLKTTYGITSADYAEMAARQLGACAACLQRPSAGPLSVDHCHRTGRIRGLLCQGCNTALGAIADDPGRAAGLIAYLDRGADWTAVRVEVAS